jgi:hypothetical protein
VAALEPVVVLALPPAPAPLLELAAVVFGF